ncbi:hypothetical protein [Rhabdochromatium marinum]|uniref:hypothetical protein n=1 Tax=Rhabdochromatium marinum TaxID=48729 RepID=UPI0019039117|nr:hypothetical protein [Rhabdochromatium marinum]
MSLIDGLGLQWDLASKKARGLGGRKRGHSLPYCAILRFPGSGIPLLLAVAAEILMLAFRLNEDAIRYRVAEVQWSFGWARGDCK